MELLYNILLNSKQSYFMPTSVLLCSKMRKLSTDSVLEFFLNIYTTEFLTNHEKNSNHYI